MSCLAGCAPKAMAFNNMTTKVALSAVVMRCPSVTNLDQDPLDVIETGDCVRVEGGRRRHRRSAQAHCHARSIASGRRLKHSTVVLTTCAKRPP
ncbi:MAG TPA: hypothetical protein VII41_01355 [Steroidobacteraceae bacterium]